MPPSFLEALSGWTTNLLVGMFRGHGLNKLPLDLSLNISNAEVWYAYLRYVTGYN
jgi:hypothetical protein